MTLLFRLGVVCCLLDCAPSRLYIFAGARYRVATCQGDDRDSALRTLRGALDRCSVDGVTTNLELHRALLADAEFAAGGVDTGYLARWLAGAAGGGADG